jgi:hypothetical protein
MPQYKRCLEYLGYYITLIIISIQFQLLPHQNVSSLIPSGEIMMSSGKYSGPTQPHGKSYFKDEVYIRNADSGKGMGFNFF